MTSMLMLGYLMMMKCGLVLGKHGVGVCNLAGEDLLQFCEINQLSVMNSFFKKRYYGTWIHPGTREYLRLTLF